MSIFLVADTKFNHQTITRTDGWPRDYQEKIQAALLKIPSKAILIHLGNICAGQDKLVHRDVFSPLSCTKILIKGKMDSQRADWYEKRGWSLVTDRMMLRVEGRDILFTHQPERYETQFDLNLHAKIQDRFKWVSEVPEEEFYRYSEFQLLESGFSPLPLEVLLNKLR
jgi:calcineurin-like phosphoesterase family protein